MIAAANKVIEVMHLNVLDFMLAPLCGVRDLRSVCIFRKRIFMVIPFAEGGKSSRRSPPATHEERRDGFSSSNLAGDAIRYASQIASTMCVGKYAFLR
jgi:hypothetical protein